MTMGIPATHTLVEAVISQIYTYMLAQGTLYGFISCWFATWLVYCPANDRKLLYLSDAFLATTAASNPSMPDGAACSSAATVYGALAFLQWLALRGASCQQPGEDMVPTGLGPAANSDSGGGGDGGGGQHGPTDGDGSTEERDAGEETGSDEGYSPSSDHEMTHKRRELEGAQGAWSDSYIARRCQQELQRPAAAALAPASPMSTQQPPLVEAPAAVMDTSAVRRPSRVLLRFQEELSAGSEGVVIAGTCDGVDCVIKLLGPDCSGLAAYEREVAAYAALEGLQGLHVPELLAWGDLKWGVRFLAVRRVAGGQPLSRLSRPIPAAVAATALRVLEAVQAACPVFVHGDVRLANMLAIPAGPLPLPPPAGAADAKDAVGLPECEHGGGRGGGGGGGQAAGTQLQCMLLDFGRSRLDGDAAQQRLELEQLRQLLAAAQQQQQQV